MNPGKRLVNRRWTIRAGLQVDHSGLQYSIIGRTYTVNARIKSETSLHRKHRQICTALISLHKKVIVIVIVIDESPIIVILINCFLKLVLPITEVT